MRLRNRCTSRKRNSFPAEQIFKMNSELIAAEIVDKLPALSADSKLNAHETIAGIIQNAIDSDRTSKAKFNAELIEAERRRLWREVAVASSRLEGMSALADRAVSEFDKRFNQQKS